MKLFHQIVLAVSIMLAILLVAVMVNDIDQSSDYLQKQMQSNAQDMATVLGITIANMPGETDEAALETLFNAFFDSGYYTDVRIETPTGELIHEKSQDVTAPDIPSWFVNAVSLYEATGQREIMKGWVNYGVLSVTLHPGYAYASLYNSFLDALFWFVVIYFTSIIILWRLLLIVMRPVKKIQDLAEKVKDKNIFTRVDLDEIRTVEMKQIGRAVNELVGKAESTFDDMGKALERENKLKRQDPLTGLGNRTDFLARMGGLCSDESSADGWLVVFHLNGLIELNQQQGYQETDNFILSFVETLKQCVNELGGEHCVRLKASEFSAYIADDEESAKSLVNKLFEWLKEQPLAKENTYVWCCAGLTPVQTGMKLGDVLSNVDFALVKAKDSGAYARICHEGDESDLPRGKEAWRKLLEKSLLDNDFFLVGQPVKNLDGTTFQKELFVRLFQANEQIISAGTFMPVATELGLDMAIDKAVFDMVMYMKSAVPAEPIAINLSKTFLSRADALSEFELFVQKYRRKVNVPLFVEISHFDLLCHGETAVNIAQMLDNVGYRLGVDRLDLTESLQLLKQVNPQYIKISASQLSAMGEDELQLGFTALKTMAGTLGIQLIAVGVDSKEMYDRLEAMGITAMQGHFISKPEKIHAQ